MTLTSPGHSFFRFLDSLGMLEPFVHFCFDMSGWRLFRRPWRYASGVSDYGQAVGVNGPDRIFAVRLTIQDPAHT